MPLTVITTLEWQIIKFFLLRTASPIDSSRNHRYHVRSSSCCYVLSLLSNPRIHLASPGLTRIHIEVDLGVASCPLRISSAPPTVQRRHRWKTPQLDQHSPPLLLAFLVPFYRRESES